jgi:predicted transcriptional regulator
MPQEDQLKKEEFMHEGMLAESARVGDTVYVREKDGTWRYADTWIKVPGARDRTLSEAFRPKLVVSGQASDAQVERVVVDGKDVKSHPGLLGWCLEEGTPLHDKSGSLIEVLVPYKAWQSRDRIPGGILAPENSQDVAEREVAIAEREYREAEHALEQAAAKRAAILHEHDGVLTRERARSITGLSVGRIQQLIRSAAGLDDVDHEILEVIRRGEGASTKDVAYRVNARMGVNLSRQAFKSRLTVLRKREVVETTAGGYRLTDLGQKALEEAQAEGS